MQYICLKTGLLPCAVYLQTTEKGDERVRDNKGHIVSPCKTLRIVFLTEIEYFAKIRFLMGNDLETSEVLYSSLFYIKSKERIYAYKDSKLFPSNTNNLN